METLGSIIDKFSITKLRLNKMADSNVEESKINLVRSQAESLKKEMDAFLFYALKGEVQLEEPKYKFYKGENPSGENKTKISEAIERLFEANNTLWNLEDLRRDKNLSDGEIRKICDDVAKYNRVRNDMIDEINSLLKSKYEETKFGSRLENIE